MTKKLTRIKNGNLSRHYSPLKLLQHEVPIIFVLNRIPPKQFERCSSLDASSAYTTSGSHPLTTVFENFQTLDKIEAKALKFNLFSWPFGM
jgi:hypothetical protein